MTPISAVGSVAVVVFWVWVIWTDTRPEERG